MSRKLASIALAGLVLFSLALGARSNGPTTDAARVEHLSEQLRCPVCDGLAVADSPSSTARAIAADVRSRVAAGETDDQIRQAYVAQYGEWILLEPPAGGFGIVAWALPVMLVVTGAGAAVWVVRRRAAVGADRPSTAAKAVVSRALAAEVDR
jgi:cytochrome c-type biogenesis protein CcmH